MICGLLDTTALHLQPLYILEQAKIFLVESFQHPKTRQLALELPAE